METFIDVETARARIVDETPTVGAERVFLPRAAGRYPADSYQAPASSPPFDNSSRDGYAVRRDDLTEGEATRLELIGRSAAGDAFDGHVGPGEAVRVLTGAPVPAGTDTIVMQEYCDVHEGADAVSVPVPDRGRGAWIRQAGAYVSKGETLIDSGAPLTAADVGLLASFGRSLIEVRRRPRVAVVTAGDELVSVDRPQDDDEICDSNAHLLAALVRAHGGDAHVSPIAADEESSVRDTFEGALETADLVVSCGGVSVGDRDVVGDILDDLTEGLSFWKVRAKPGKPLAFGITDRNRAIPTFGLPGNPNSCFVSFHQFVRPALEVAQGRPGDGADPETFRARLADDVESTSSRRQYLAGRLEPGRRADWVFHPFDQQKSANVGLFCGADAFGRVAEDVDHIPAGEQILVEEIPRHDR